jgi:DMSO/TMAO reductase YedYZ molybdopterin-dependent catalytic subunit
MNPQEIPQIVSPDTLRQRRIPPGQVETRKWPVLHVGPTPRTDLSTWSFSIRGLVTKPVEMNWQTFSELPRVRVLGDMHCVTAWSKLNNAWEGVSTRELLRHVEILPQAAFVMVHCEHGFTTNLPLADFLDEDCLFAFKHNDQDLELDHGWPVRLVVPKLYAWKSAKWVRGIDLMAKDKAGFWEQWHNGGYHMRGDPWVEQRHRDD